MASSLRLSFEGRRLHRLPSASFQLPVLSRFERRDAVSFVIAKRKGDVVDIDEATRAKRLFEKQAAKEAGLVKRKVALYVGYVGTDYSGLQLSTLEHVKTIEGELQQALLAHGCITESNAASLGKVKWSRSSRTDKGVHSLATVVALKCLVDEAKFDVDPEGLELAEGISRHLPKTVRVFSVQRVNDGFFARKMCIARSYCYYLPVSLLTGTEDVVSEDIEQACLERFREALHLYIGRHGFHNYTKRRQYIDNNDPWSYGRRRREKEKAASKAPLEEDDASNDASNEASNDDEDALLQQSVSAGENEEGDNRRVPAGRTTTNEYQALIDKERETGRWRFWNYEFKADIDPNDCVVAPHYRNIMDFTADDPASITEGGIRAVRCRVHGVSFMLHQIRYMIGAAIAVARQLISLRVLESSLKACIRINLPLAPPEPLTLMDSEFSPFPFNAGSKAIVSKWSGDKLELKVGGQSAQQTFLDDIMLPEIDRLLQLPEWQRWSEILSMVTYKESDHDDVARVMEQYDAWVQEKQQIKEMKRQALEKEFLERGIDRETWMKERKQKSKRQDNRPGP